MLSRESQGGLPKGAYSMELKKGDAVEVFTDHNWLTGKVIDVTGALAIITVYNMGSCWSLSIKRAAWDKKVRLVVPK